MNDDAVRVHQIDFNAAVPSLHLLKTIQLAFSVQCLLPSVLACLLFSMLPEEFFRQPSGPQQGVLWEVLPRPLNIAILDTHYLLWAGTSAGWLTPVRLLLILLVLGFTGAAITRAAGIQFCSHRRTGAVRAMRHAARQWKPTVISMLLLFLLGMVAVLLFRMGNQLCLGLSGIGGPSTVLQFTLWLSAAILLLAFGVTGSGWLLSTASIGVDSCDGAEALSRGISYVLSLFWRCVCYAVIILLLASCSKMAITFLLSLATDLTSRSLNELQPGHGLVSPSFASARNLLQEAVKLSAFFSGISIAYVLFRNFEDNVAFRETDSGAQRPS